ncbi:MAG: HIT family protein [Panacagrimonas sp.]
MTIFDAIISGKLPASFVHQDEHCVAFMDISPVNRGHVLVVPRESVTTLDDLAPETCAHLWVVAQRIGRAQRAGLGSAAQHLLINDGKGASQSVPHVHIHVIPRYRGDTAKTVMRMIWHISTLALPKRESAAKRADLENAATAIAEAMPGV